MSSSLSLFLSPPAALDLAATCAAEPWPVGSHSSARPRAYPLLLSLGQVTPTKHLPLPPFLSLQTKPKPNRHFCPKLEPWLRPILATTAVRTSPQAAPEDPPPHHEHTLQVPVLICADFIFSPTRPPRVRRRFAVYSEPFSDSLGQHLPLIVAHLRDKFFPSAAGLDRAIQDLHGVVYLLPPFSGLRPPSPSHRRARRPARRPARPTRARHGRASPSAKVSWAGWAVGHSRTTRLALRLS